MNLPMATLQGVYRKVQTTLETASDLGEVGAGTGEWHLVLSLGEIRALHMLLAQGLDTPDCYEGNFAANLAGGRVTDHPDNYGQPTQFMHTIVVKDAAAVPGVQAMLYLRRGVRDVGVSPSFDRTHWQLTWAEPFPDVDLDFLRPHILPVKPH